MSFSKEEGFDCLDDDKPMQFTSTKINNIGIIIHSRSAYDMDWNTLVPATHSDELLVLIASLESIKKLTEINRKAFAVIYTTETFDFDHLSIIFHKIHQEIYHKGDKTRVSTVAEYDMIVTAELRDHFRDLLSIDGPSLNTILNFRDKLQMKAILANQGVRIPRYIKFDRFLFIKDSEIYLENLRTHLNFPMFAKPIDGAASIGTALIKNEKQLRDWCNDKLTVFQEFEIDEYIEGKLFHCDSIIQNGKIEFTFVSKYLHPNADARLGLPLATMTLDFSDPDHQRLKDFAENALKQFPNLPDGCTHLEVFISKHNELIFLEVAARPPGSRAPEMYRLRTNGIDLRALHTKLNLGINVDNEIRHLRDETKWGPYASMWDLVSPAEDSIIEELHSPVLDSEYRITWKYQRQDTVSGGIFNGDVIASVVFWHNNYSVLVNDFNSLDSQHLVSINPVVEHTSSINKIKTSIPSSALLESDPLPEYFNKGPGCAISHPAFFNKRNLAIGVASMLPQISDQSSHSMRHSPIKTEVDPVLLLCLLAGSATIVVFLIYALWRILPTKEIVENNNNQILSRGF